MFYCAPDTVGFFVQASGFYSWLPMETITMYTVEINSRLLFV